MAKAVAAVPDLIDALKAAATADLSAWLEDRVWTELDKAGITLRRSRS